jgi:hypothetical protein
MSSRILAGTGALAIALLVPAGASAATIEPLKPCYVAAETDAGPQSEGMVITASGFQANAKVDLTINGEAPPGGTGLQADPSGALGPLPEIPVPFVEQGAKDFLVTLTEEGNETNTVSVTSRTVALDVSVKPRVAKPSSIVRFKGGGFTVPDRGVWAHYISPRGKVRTVRMARTGGRCGTWKKRARQIPVRRARPGQWIVQFDQSRKYVNPAKRPGVLAAYVRVPISVTLEPPGR